MAEFEPDPRFPSEVQRLEERQAEIEECLCQLKSKNPRARSQAAKRLGELRAGLEGLLAALNDVNSYVRSAAAFALGYAAGAVDNGEVIEGLLGMIDDTSDHVCAAAIHSLGVMRAETAREQILACLDDANPVVVQAALLAAARIGPDPFTPGQAESLGERLAAFLDGDQYMVLLAATRAVFLLNYQPAAPRLLENLRETLRSRTQKDFKLPKAYIETLAKLQCLEAIPMLIEAARREVGLRSAAVEALIELKAADAAPILATLLTDPSDGLRRRLVEMMVAADYRAALPLVRPLLRDPSAQIRDAALVAVSAWNDPAAVEDVRRIAFKDPNPFVRPQAIAALGALLGQEAVPDLLVLARDANTYARQVALETLEQLGCPPPQEGEPAAGTPSTRSEKGQADLFPKEIPSAAGLLAQLEAWQVSLSAMAASGRPLEEVAALDSALTTLIQYIKK